MGNTHHGLIVSAQVLQAEMLLLKRGPPHLGHRGNGRQLMSPTAPFPSSTHDVDEPADRECQL